MCEEILSDLYAFLALCMNDRTLNQSLQVYGGPGVVHHVLAVHKSEWRPSLGLHWRGAPFGRSLSMTLC